MSKRPIQRIAILISMVSFFGSIVFGAVSAVNSALKPTQNNTKTSLPSQKQLRSQLKLQEREYEVVLKQEPENQIALEEIVKMRLERKDTKGAIKPLKKLLELHPNQQEYKVLLAQLNKENSKGDR